MFVLSVAISAPQKAASNWVNGLDGVVTSQNAPGALHVSVSKSYQETRIA